MGKYQDGQYIILVWDGFPDAHYVKGHVSDEDGRDIVINEACLDEDQAKKLGQAEHKYGRWSTEADGPEGCSQTLREYKSPGRGRFKITVFGVGIFAKAEPA